MIIRSILILIFCLSTSCSKERVEVRHQEAVRDGYEKLPIAKSLLKKFGAWSFIIHWNIPNDPEYGMEKNEKEWQTVTYIYGRYELIYTQNVILEKNGGKVSKKEVEPILLIREISNIFGDPNAATTDFSNYQVTIKGKKLENLFESNWDFNKIGLNLKEGEPLKNIIWKRNYWSRIYPLQNQE